jgi:hypothetical protein
MNTILFFIILFLFLSNLIFIFKFIKIKNIIKSYYDIGTGRYGFYENKQYMDHSNASYVYVKEIDRYSNGYSEIKISKIEAFNKTYETDAVRSAKIKFISLKLTNEINWLEGEEHIKKIRKEKLDKIKKV